jgi:hypothetical protein
MSVKSPKSEVGGVRYHMEILDLTVDRISAGGVRHSPKSENQGCQMQCVRDIGSDWDRRCRGSHTINRSDLQQVTCRVFPPQNALPYLLLFIDPMPPKKSPLSGLTTAEQFLLFIASRIDGALRYLDANPSGDKGMYVRGLADEIVRRTISLTVMQTHLYHRKASTPSTVNSRNPKMRSTGCMGRLPCLGKSGSVQQHRRPLPTSDVSLLLPWTGPVQTPRLPFQSGLLCCTQPTSLSLHRSNRRRCSGGWRTKPQMVCTHTLSLLFSLTFPSSGLRRSGRSNKGKAPAPPDAMEVDQPRGKKRSAPTQTRGDEDSSGDGGSEGDGDPTPRKTATSSGHPPFHVVVNSPPNTRPKQRQRMDADIEAAEAAEASAAEKAAVAERAVAAEKAVVERAAVEKAAAEKAAAEKAAAKKAAAAAVAAKAVEVAEHAEVVAAAEVSRAAAVGAVSEKLWVGTGEVSRSELHLHTHTCSFTIQARCTDCIEFNNESCVPQWYATKPSKACLFCARRKKSCNAPKEWLEQVKAHLRLEKVGGGRKGTVFGSICGQRSSHSDSDSCGRASTGCSRRWYVTAAQLCTS